MPAVPADLSISSRWILPMRTRGEVLENHTLLVRDGRIIDVLPSAAARERYTAVVSVDRPSHALMPGLVNAHTRIVGRGSGSAGARDDALLSIAELLASGTTCFCTTGFFPAESALTAAEQGMRAVIGMPISDAPSAWAKSSADYLTRALDFRDEYRGHPTIATAFAPHAAHIIGDATFGRVATLAAELDAGVVMSLHESRAEVDESLARHGLRPIDRIQALGLLTPALTAMHMNHVSAGDIALAERSGIAIGLCPEADLQSGNGPPPVASWVQTGLRLGLGTGVESEAGSDPWGALKLLALFSRQPGAGAANPWDTLTAATRGGAAALGLDADIGTLDEGKWADLCCVDLDGPGMRRALGVRRRPAGEDGVDIIAALVLGAARDQVSDVWVSGRQLFNHRTFTRLDWPALAQRLTRATEG